VQNRERFTELVERAACDINMLGPTDFSDADRLQEIFDEIKQSIDRISEGPSELLARARDATANANDLLGKILRAEVDDVQSSIGAVSEAIQTLQDICGEIDQPDGTEPVDTDTAAESPEDADAAVCIAEDDVPLVLDFIAESTEHLENAEAGLLELENAPENTEILNQIFRAFHTIKGTAGFLNLKQIGSVAHSAENLLDMARKGELLMAGANSDAVFESIDMLKKMTARLREHAETAKPLAPQDGVADLLAKLESLARNQALETSLNTPEGREKDDQLDELLKDTPPAEIKGPPAAGKGSVADEKIKVSTKRLDELINMTGELVIAQLMVAEDVRASAISGDVLSRNIAHQGKIIRELQELSMSMRMVPISRVFQKMARLVRDLARKADKKIEFVMSGEETELDRTIVDRIADPLVHMMRNCVDHGIEPAQERIEANKKPAGRIELRAFHKAGNIVIEIKDDGRGLDKDRILKKAVANGIVDAQQNLSDDEIFKLIFHAGLSTASRITSISGRGVGMDVVKKNIESLRGKIDISSTPGKGTVFTIRLPLTLAIIDGQVVRVGDDLFIIPINSIEQSLRPTAQQLSTVMNRVEMATIRGQLLPVVRLYELFGIAPTTDDPTKALLVVVEEDGSRCCLLVDELLAQQQVVIKSLGQSLGKIRGVSGGAIMGDGRIRLILDIPGLIELAQEHQLKEGRQYANTAS